MKTKFHAFCSIVKVNNDTAPKKGEAFLTLPLMSDA